MNSALYRTVTGAVTALTSRLKPSARAPGQPSNEAHDVMHYTFPRRMELEQDLSRQLTDCSEVLEQMAVKLHRLQTHVVNLRNQLVAAHNATEQTWDGVKAGFSKEHRELLDGVRHARPWATRKP